MKKFLIFPTLLLTLSACGPMQPPTPRTTVQNGNIIEITLEDGTRCAVFDGFKAGGLSCDWNSNE